MINKIIKVIKNYFQPKKRDFWRHIADARVNKNNPDYNLVKQAEILQNARIILANRRQVDVNEISPLEAYNWLDAWVTGQELGVEI
jgi:hypothetical protein